MSRSTDHPHARGENSSARRIRLPTCGPSPRAWGELPGYRFLTEGCRTIPTRVGRTASFSRQRECQSDHPHARGENSRAERPQLRRNGPSPRAWGELSTECWLSHGIRTIPTRVGRTSLLSLTHRPAPDHPHARGENLRRRLCSTRRVGPSPRAWGERSIQSRWLCSTRTIPTRVGRTGSLQ